MPASFVPRCPPYPWDRRASARRAAGGEEHGGQATVPERYGLSHFETVGPLAQGAHDSSQDCPPASGGAGTGVVADHDGHRCCPPSWARGMVLAEARGRPPWWTAPAHAIPPAAPCTDTAADRCEIGKGYTRAEAPRTPRAGGGQEEREATASDDAATHGRHRASGQQLCSGPAPVS